MKNRFCNNLILFLAVSFFFCFSSCNLAVESPLEKSLDIEESKSGFLYTEVLDAIKEISQLPNIFIKGLMAIPPICENSEDNRKYFKEMYKLFIDIGREKIDNSSMEFLSMGMSDDFDVAVSEGANLVRLGTALFGKRIYK